MSSEYEDLADEYYDPRAHPTIALLRAGSRIALETLRAGLFGEGGVFAEVGSGRGMLHSVADDTVEVVSFDLNPSMLRDVPGFGIVGDATALPVLDSTFDGVFASLCDPYNTPDFLREARRVLKPGGRLLLTVPDHRWVRHNQAREGVVDAAVVTSKAGPVTVPSFVHEPEKQIALLRSHGFNDVRVYDTRLAVAAETTGIMSPRLLDEAGTPVSENVTNAYLAR